MSTLLKIVLITALFSLITALIAENRHPVKTLAWILVLVFLPGIGLILFFLFGIDKKDKKLISDEELKTLKTHTINNYLDNIVNIDEEPAKLLQVSNQSIPLGGNSVTVFTTYDSMFISLIKDLKEAKDHIHFQFFKFEDDDSGRTLGKILIKKAKEGVKVRVLYDDAANLTRKRFYKWLKKEGVEVQPFLKVEIPFLSSNTNYRNHRKVVVVDGCTAYCGGMNIADRYSRGINDKDWRDTHFKVYGPAASELQTSFLTDWIFATKNKISEISRYYPKCETTGNVKMQVATSGVMDKWHVTMQGMISIISQAKKYVYLESPYFIPSEPFMMALKNAALSGIDVRLIIPLKGDKGILTPLASRSYIEDALTAGVKIFFYNGGYMHAKTIVSDDYISTIGSTNIDIRSFEQDFEVNGFFYDRQIANTLRDAFLKDQNNSIEVHLNEWVNRPKYERITESFARLFSMLL